MKLSIWKGLNQQMEDRVLYCDDRLAHSQVMRYDTPIVWLEAEQLLVKQAVMLLSSGVIAQNTCWKWKREALVNLLLTTSHTGWFFV